MAEKMDTFTVQASRFVDAVKDAGAVAPSKVGAAFSSAAGVFFEIFTVDGQPYLCVKASNLVVWYSTVVPLEELSQSDPKTVQLRMPSSLLMAVSSALPNRMSDTVKIGWQNRSAFFRAGKVQARLPLMEDPGILWNDYEAKDLGRLTGLSRLLGQLSWCAKADGEELSGILFSGEYAWSTDRHVLACVKLSFDRPLEDRFVIKPSVLSSIVSDGVTYVGLKSGLVTLSTSTAQIQVEQYEQSRYPGIETLPGKMEFQYSLTVSRQQLLASLRSVEPFLKEKRERTIDVRTTGLTIGPRFSDDDMGSLFRVEADCIDPTEHAPVLLRITSDYVNGALSALTCDTVIVRYTSTGLPMEISDPTGDCRYFISTIKKIVS